MKYITYNSYAPLEAMPERKEAIFLYVRVETETFPSKVKYSTRFLDPNKGKNEKRELFVIAPDKYTHAVRSCVEKLKELNFNFNYGLARDALQYLRDNGMFKLA